MHGFKGRALLIAGSMCCALLGTVWAPGVAGAVGGSKWAVVSSPGVLVRSNGATAAIRVVKGLYEVIFSSNQTGCAYEATSGDPGAGSVSGPIEMAVSSMQGNPKGVVLEPFDETTGLIVDVGFHLTTYCGTKATYAVIASDGSTARGSHVTSSTRRATGEYEVAFDHNVSKCAFSATVGRTGAGSIEPGEITVAGRIGNNNAVFVHTMDRTAAAVDNSFHLAVDCGGNNDIGVISSDGTKARGLHVVSSTRLNVGKYGVVFDRNVTACAYTATIGEPGNLGEVVDPVTVTTARLLVSLNGVFVFIHNVSGAVQDEPFHLKVTC